MAKHVLQNDTGFDFALTGIVCGEDQYRLVSMVNDVLGISLFLSDFVKLLLKNDQEFSFSLYRFLDESSHLEFLLIPNLSNYQEQQRQGASDLFSDLQVDESVRLIKELPRTDYFLIIHGDSLPHVQHKVNGLLRQLPALTQVQSIDPLSLPSRRNLIF